MTRVWIGGSPCAGKSTVAGLVAEALGLPLYSCDDAFDRHVAEGGGPTMRKVTTMPVGDRLSQPIEVQVADVLRLGVEEFPMIVRDLPASVVVEGAALLPSLLAAAGVTHAEAVWIVPTDAFQRRHYGDRPWAHELLAGLPAPDEAFDRWMRRDATFATRIAASARDLGYHVITIDGTTSPAETAAEVLRRHSPTRQ
ncbi:hypothetical protein KOI35_13485 [Actinoplanes bogorensis]|uniref:AAA family ATPase n=1 Tax=Paractinoplanes bogorensis TaxID=1610840 RepID=A0ABS5YM16_9ACTN|nr:hypothetical protein [Actinoplanes bogorensis]MBU2664510.1 hypothetical protein [Actinoplanes bogorensis]